MKTSPRTALAVFIIGLAVFALSLAAALPTPAHAQGCMLDVGTQPRVPLCESFAQALAAAQKSSPRRSSSSSRQILGPLLLSGEPLWSVATLKLPFHKIHGRYILQMDSPLQLVGWKDTNVSSYIGEIHALDQLRLVMRVGSHLGQRMEAAADVAIFSSSLGHGFKLQGVGAGVIVLKPRHPDGAKSSYSTQAGFRLRMPEGVRLQATAGPDWVWDYNQEDTTRGLSIQCQVEKEF